MQKLTRKLMLSIMAAAFAVITLGATTFAWFTLSNTAQIESFNITLTSGTGIEISVNGTTYGNSIPPSAMTGFLTGKTIDDITSPDGNVFMDFEDLTSQEPDQYANDTSYVFFPIYFRSPEAGVKVYLLDSTDISSTGIGWFADASFTGARGNTVASGEADLMYYAANSLRMSFTVDDLTALGIRNDTTPLPTEIPGDPVDDYYDVQVFELTPSYPTAPVGKANDTNTMLGTTFQNGTNDGWRADLANGAISYYFAKTAKYPAPIAYPDETQMIFDADNNPGPTLPQVYYTSTHLLPSAELETAASLTGKPILVTLDRQLNVSGINMYYGVIYCRIWIEGWDPDCLNPILGDTNHVVLGFGGTKVEAA